jgi:hypothetical protein
VSLESYPLHCKHDEVTLSVHENADRIRVLEMCAECRVSHHAVFPKRLSDVPDQSGNREAWGPVGVWTVKRHDLR